MITSLKMKKDDGNIDESNLESIARIFLYPIKALIRHHKFQKISDYYDDGYGIDMLEESTGGHKAYNPYDASQSVDIGAKTDK